MNEPSMQNIIACHYNLGICTNGSCCTVKQGGCGRQWPGNYNVRSPERIDSGVRQGQIKPGKSGDRKSVV